MGTRARPKASRRWNPGIDGKHYLAGGEMPAVFATFDRTQLLAFLAIYGPATTGMLAIVFGVPRPSMIRRLQAAERIGLVERVCKGFVKWNRLNRDHPAYSQIKRLAKSLGRIFPIPAGVVHRMSFSAMGSKPRLYAAVDVFGAGQHAARAESLLFLGALDESVPISRLSGVFGRDRFPTTGAIDALEAFGMVRSIRQRKQRLVSLDHDWVAYEDLSRLIRRLNRIDPTYADLAAAYLAVGGNVASIR